MDLIWLKLLRNSCTVPYLFCLCVCFIRPHRNLQVHIQNQSILLDLLWPNVVQNSLTLLLVLSLFAVPPTIVDHRSSADLVVREKERVNLTCQARGYPEPQILWRREDGGPVMASGQVGLKGRRVQGFIPQLGSSSVILTKKLTNPGIEKNSSLIGWMMQFFFCAFTILLFAYHLKLSRLL